MIQFREMPKLDLHLHIDGAVRTDTILELAREQNHVLPADNVQELERFVRVGPECRSLTEFLATFEVFYELLRQPEALQRVTWELCQDLQEDGVIYAELRFAPILNIRDLGRSKAEMRAMVLAAVEGVRAARTDSFDARLILCCYRGFDTEYALETVELVRDLRDELGDASPIVGVDLAGDESRYPAEGFRGPFDLARDYGIPATVHAAEAAGPASARAALDILHASRIGHGIRIAEDAELLERVRSERIPLEVCLTSNLQTQTVRTVKEHPFADYLRSGVCVTLNTDDPRVSGITLSSEWALAASTFALTAEEIQLLTGNSVEAAFCNEATKDSLRQRLAEYFGAQK